jgi:hypothetical protein
LCYRVQAEIFLESPKERGREKLKTTEAFRVPLVSRGEVRTEGRFKHPGKGNSFLTDSKNKDHDQRTVCSDSKKKVTIRFLHSCLSIPGCSLNSEMESMAPAGFSPNHPHPPTSGDN